MESRRRSRAGAIVALVAAFGCAGKSTRTGAEAGGSAGEDAQGGSGGEAARPSTGGIAGTTPTTGGRGGSGTTGGSGISGSAGTSDVDGGETGQGGTTAGSGPSSGGSGGSGGASWQAGCSVFCRSLLGSCDGTYADYTVCMSDCIESSERVAPACRELVSPYLYCAGATESCSSLEVPSSCSTETSLLASCLIGEQPSCYRSLDAEVEGCTLTQSCDGTNDVVECDGENDGTGTSLCQCSRDGAGVPLSSPTDGVGLIACVNAARECGFLVPSPQ